VVDNSEKNKERENGGYDGAERECNSAIPGPIRNNNGNHDAGNESERAESLFVFQQFAAARTSDPRVSETVDPATEGNSAGRAVHGISGCACLGHIS